MGLNIGVCVKKQAEGYMDHGRNPQMGLPELEEDFFRFLNERFPEGGFGPGGVSLSRRHDGEEWFDFDVRPARYGSDCDVDALYLAIVEYVFGQFSHSEGIVMETYHSP